MFYSIFESIFVTIFVSENSTVISILCFFILKLYRGLNLELISLISRSTLIYVILTNRAVVVVTDWRSFIYLFSLSIDWMLYYTGFILIIFVHIAIFKFYISIGTISTTTTTTKQIALILVNFLESDLVSSTWPFNLIMNSSILLN